MLTKNELLAILLGDDSEKSVKMIHQLYLCSSHKKLLLSIYNETIQIEPKYYDTVNCLSQYQMQCWAAQCRIKYKISIDDLINELKDVFSGHNEFFGITSHDGFTSYFLSLKQTDTILSFIQEVITKNTYPYIFRFHILDEDLSSFLLNSHYRDELWDFCKKHSEKIRLLKIETNPFNEYDYSVAYHNTYILIKNMPIMHSMKYGDDINYQKMYQILKKCIVSLKEFPYEKDLYPILSEYSKGKSEIYIANKLGKSRKYVRSKKEHAIFIISCILWGII